MTAQIEQLSLQLVEVFDLLFHHLLAVSSFYLQTVKQEGALLIDYQVTFTQNADGGNVVAGRSIVQVGLLVRCFCEVLLFWWVRNRHRKMFGGNPHSFNF